MPMFLCIEVPQDLIGVTRAQLDDMPGVCQVAEGYSLADLVGKLEARVPPPEPEGSGRKRVYIAGPISRGDLRENVNQATAAFVELAKAGFAPMCPHWSVYSKPAFWFTMGDDPRRYLHCEGTAMGNDDMTHADWLGVDLPWVAVSDAVLRLPGESKGADAEVSHAVSLQIPVFTRVSEVVSYFAEAPPQRTSDYTSKPTGVVAESLRCKQCGDELGATVLSKNELKTGTCIVCLWHAQTPPVAVADVGGES